MTNAITPATQPAPQQQPTAALAPARTTGRPLITKESLVEEGQQRQLLMSYVKAHMTEGTDFGVIPGTKNKTLLKPGAEKLIDLFRCVPQYEVIEKIEDWDKPFIHYLFRCRVARMDDGTVVAEGFGSANSHERKYRYRLAERKCPQCGAAAIKKSKFPPKDDPQAPPGFYCFAKAGGCGAEFDHDDADITEQQLGQVENPDVADSANTILKIAKKRSLVDASISLVRCSDMFTQDVEDFDDAGPAATASRPAQTQQQRRPQHQQHHAPPPAEWQPHPDDVDALVASKDLFKAEFAKTGWKWKEFIAWACGEFDHHYDADAGWEQISEPHRTFIVTGVLKELHSRAANPKP